jgi:hypothetical protein
MISSTMTHMVGSILLLLATTLVNASPLPAIKRDTAERYTFANCINNVTSASYAAIFWYYPDFLPDFPEPQATAYVDEDSAIEWAGKTISVSTPFTLKAVIPSNATTASVGSIVSTDASASSFAGPMAVIKGSGDVFYTPDTDVNCYEEYWQRDVSCFISWFFCKSANKSKNQPVEDP